MKLVARLGREDSDRIVREIGQIGDPGYAWLSTWWEPTEEDYIYESGKRNGYAGGENGFSQLASSFITDGSVVYAALSSIFGERPLMIQNPQERGFPYAIPLWS